MIGPIGFDPTHPMTAAACVKPMMCDKVAFSNISFVS